MSSDAPPATSPSDLAIVSVTILSFMGGLIAAMTAVSLWAVQAGGTVDGGWVLSISILCMEGSLGAGAVVGAAHLGQPPALTWPALSRRLGFTSVHPQAVVAAVVGVLGLNLVLGSFIDLLGFDFGTLARLRRTLQAADGLEMVVLVAVMTLLPAVGEELLFRGYVFRAWRASRSAATAVGGSAFLFGVVHLDPVQSPMAFMLGLYVGWAVLRTDSLWVGIAAHAANNGAACVGSLFDSGLPPALWLGLGSFLAALAILRLRCFSPAEAVRW